MRRSYCQGLLARSAPRGSGPTPPARTAGQAPLYERLRRLCRLIGAGARALRIGLQGELRPKLLQVRRIKEALGRGLCLWRPGSKAASQRRCRGEQVRVFFDAVHESPLERLFSTDRITEERHLKPAAHPEGTAEKIDNGWLRTGDVGSMTHDGWLRITDRTKDVIKSGGEWISSGDLESALMAHPAVAEAAVIARPDERWSERPLACVVVVYEVTPDELRAFLADRVARWWLPDDFAYMTEIPRTSVGKFDKRVLRRQLKAAALDVRAVGGHSS